jgi:hypothetical protein
MNPAFGRIWKRKVDVVKPQEVVLETLIQGNAQSSMFVQVTEQMDFLTHKYDRVRTYIRRLKLTKPNSMVRMNIYLSRQQRDGFAKLARKRGDGTSESSIIRAVLDAYLGIVAVPEQVAFKNPPPAK